MIVALTPIQQFSAILCQEQVNFQRDDEIRFELDQHTKLDFNTASPLEQQFANRHVASLIIMIPS